MDRLIKILSHKRPAGSITERHIIKELITDHYDHVIINGNVVITVGTGSTTLFSCHTDTVHEESGTQMLTYDENFNRILLDRPAKAEPPAVKEYDFDAVWGRQGHSFGVHAGQQRGERTCLGADDGAGMYLLLEMIDAEVPGTYVFHHSEECGGLGSRALSTNTAFLSQFKRAVAFDRKGTGDIIDYQRSGRCCSSQFVDALAAQLKIHDLHYKAATGSFTDTANYTTTIPECTNLSCGYYNEHGPDEWLDLEHLTALRGALVKVDWEALPTVRDPKEVYNPRLYRGARWGKAKTSKPITIASLKAMSLDELEYVCRWEPDTIADLLFTGLHPSS